MDRESDELIRQMLVAASRLAEERAAEVVSIAAAEAEAEVRALVKSAMKAALIQEVAGQLEPSRPPAPPAPSPMVRPSRAATTDVSSTSDSIGSYVYCITPADRVTLPSATPVDPALPLRLVEHEHLAAVVSDVPLEEFRRSVDPDRDLQWLGVKVTAHNQVIQAVAASSPVIPLQFATILRSDRDVIGLLDRHHEELQSALANLEGQAEFGVKIRRAQPPNNAVHAVESDDDAGTGSGTAYMTRKHKARIGRERRQESLHQLAHNCHQRLAECATDSRLLQIGAAHTARLENGSGELLINGAYLVRDPHRHQFQMLVHQLTAESEEQGLTNELSGPWPPYNFVNLNFIAGEGSQ